MFESKPSPFTPIDLPFHFECSCQDLNNPYILAGMVPSSWKRREREGRLPPQPASRLAFWKKPRCCCSNTPVNFCVFTGGREAQLVHNIGASPAIPRYATVQWAAVVVMHCSPLVYLVSRQHTASWAGVHSNHTVNGIVYILKIKHIFKIQQPHFIVVRVWMLLRMAQLLNS